MNRKYVIVILILIIIVCVFYGKKSNDNEINNNIEEGNKTYYNIVINEETGENEYIIYNSVTNEEIVRVSEDEKYKLDIYETDPDFEEIESDEIVMPEFGNEPDIIVE